MRILSKVPSQKQLAYWESLKGKSPIGIDNHGKKPWNKNTKGLLKANSGSFAKGERRSINTEFKKGNTSWSKTHSYEMPKDSDHHAWKGQEASYGSKHSWVSRKKGKPSLCDFCGTTTAKRFEWANISGLYLRDLNDYIRLCKSCHERHDRTKRKELAL